MGIPIPVLLNNLVGLFLLLGAGFASAKLKFLSDAAAGHFTALLMKVTLPATIFTAMLRPFDAAFLKDSVVIFLLGLGLFLASAMLCVPAVRLFRVKEGGRGMWMICCTFCNNGFMGYPVILALFGEDALALAAMMGISFNLLVYTLGARQVLLDAQPGQSVVLSWKKLIFTGVNASTVLGLVFFCLQLAVPAAILTPLQHLANITTPLSMFLIGMTLARGSLGEAFRERDVFSACLMRLLILPVLTWAVLKLLPIGNPMIPWVALITVAMPAPAVSGVLAEQYGCNTKLSAQIVFLSSLLCIVTIPLVAMLP